MFFGSDIQCTLNVDVLYTVDPNGLGPEPVRNVQISILNGQLYDFQLTYTKITMNIVIMPVRISKGLD